MKILYITANPDDQEPIDLSPEITQVQRRVFDAPFAEFIALPSLRFEDLPSVLDRQRPDILHIVSHSDSKNLMIANYEGESVELDSDMLLSFISDVHPPRLIYLNACNSTEIAKSMIRIVPMAIGSNAPISVKSARSAAMAFYDRLLSGDSVGRAYAVCNQMMRGVGRKSARMEIHCQSMIDPHTVVLYEKPNIIAEFVGKNPARDDEDCYQIRFGVLGCPQNTQQVVFFTDDPESLSDEETLENDLCSVVRDPPRRGLVLMAEGDAWDIDGDFRLYAVGVSGDGSSFTLTSMLCDALDLRYRVAHSTKSSPKIAAAIEDLRQTDGSRLL